MVYPNYQSVTDHRVRKKFEKLWGQELDSNVGLTVIEIAEKAFEKSLKGLYIMGENPAMSDPNLNFTREALSRLDFMVVQDIFFAKPPVLPISFCQHQRSPKKTVLSLILIDGFN